MEKRMDAIGEEERREKRNGDERERRQVAATSAGYGFFSFFLYVALFLF